MDTAPTDTADTGLDSGDPTAPRIAERYDCTTDALAPEAEQGVFETGPLGEIVALCDGELLAGDVGQQGLVWLDAVEGAVRGQWAVLSAPRTIALDVETGALFGGGSRLNLQTEVASPFAGLTDAVSALQLGADGALWALRPGVALDVLSKEDGSILRSSSISVPGELFAAEPAKNRLFVAQQGQSRPQLSRLSFNEAGELIVEETIREESCANGQSLTLSPDGRQLAFACAGADVLADRNPNALAEVQGLWGLRVSPRAAAFSPDGALLAGSNGTELHIFQTDGYRRQTFVTLPECDFSVYRQVGFSRGGTIVWAYTSCGFDEDRGQIAWFTLDALLAEDAGE